MVRKLPKALGAMITSSTSVSFYGLSMLTSLLNFLYYPVLARLLPVEQYGEVQFIVTILFQISVLFLALNVISIIITLTYAHDRKALSKKVAGLSSILNLATGLLTIGLVVVLSVFYGDFNLNSPLPFIAMGIAIISTVPFTLGVGLLQGEDRYISAGSLNATGAGLKLILSVLFVLMGLGVIGAVLGIAIGQLSAFLFFSLMNRGILKVREILSLSRKHFKALKTDRVLIVSSLWIVLVNILMSADVIVAKIALSAEDAGLYAGIATLSKIAIFVVSPLMWLVIPVAAGSSSQSTLRFVGIASLFCVLLSIGYLLFGDLALTLIVGSDYLVYEKLLVIATVSSSLLAIAAMLNIILLAQRRYTHAAIQALIMTIGFIAGIWSAVDGKGFLLAVLVGQVTAGSLGVIYYSIIRLIKREATNDEISH